MKRKSRIWKNATRAGPPEEEWGRGGGKKNNDCSKISEFSDKICSLAKEQQEEIKKKLENMLIVCLGNIESLQGVIRQKNSKHNDDDENMTSLEQKCADLKPIDLTDKPLFFDDVIGLQDQKDDLIKSFIKPLQYPNLYPGLGKGFLYYGFPGTGKTYLAKAAVNELTIRAKDDIGVLYLAPTGAELKGKYVGETEKNIKKVWDCASHRAYECEKKYNDDPKKNRGKCKKFITIIFIDEFDSIGKSRDDDPTGLAANAVNTFLQMTDGISSPKNVAVMAATNYPWNLDSAILRRFNKQAFLRLPTADDIGKLIRLEVAKNASIKEYVLL